MADRPHGWAACSCTPARGDSRCSRRLTRSTRRAVGRIDFTHTRYPLPRSRRYRLCMSTPVGGSSVDALEYVTALRCCTLAVSVIHEVDMVPTDDGILLLGVPDIPVSFEQLAEAIAGADPADSVAQDRLHRWLRARRAIADKSLDELAETIRPVALPIG